MLTVMQVSIVVPMAVVWWRRRHFPPEIKLLSGYVYLSVAAVVGARVLCPAYFETNYGFLTGFNLGKIALFAAVYYQVVASAKTRRLVVATTVATLTGVFVVMLNDWHLAVAVSRVAQCALLAGFAMVYLEQTLNRRPLRPLSQDPMWLLGIGQLLYSAGTVTAFSLEYLTTTIYDQSSKFIFVSIAGLVFNYFLTLAFLRANRLSSSPAETQLSGAIQLANS
ncbi:MAG TPA: hypothetical protein VF629_04505 [Hymenobacter sp.]